MNKIHWAGAALLAFGLAAGRAGAQAPQPVLSQTIRGVTVRLSNIIWFPAEPQDGRFVYSKSLYFDYTLKADRPIPLPPGKGLLDFVTAVTLVAPDGSRMPDSGSGYSKNASGAKISAEANWEDVDPRWPLAAIDIEFADPTAPPRARGISSDPIIIEGIPVPTETDKTVKVHAETVTPLGTHVIVEKVRISPGAVGTKTMFVFRVVPDPAAPDLDFSFSVPSKAATDDTGGQLGTSTMVSTGDELDHEPGRELRSAGVSGVPAPGAQTMRLTLDATESSERLKDDVYFRHFRLLVPLASLYPGPPRAYPPLMTEQGAEVTGLVDTLNWNEDRYRLRLVLRDRADPGIRWQVRGLSAKDDAGNLLTGKVTHDDNFLRHGDDFFWKADGTALGLGESALDTRLGGVDAPDAPWGVAPATPAKTLTLTVDAQAFRVHDHLLDFAKLPIPTDGQTLTPGRAVTDAFGGRLVLRKIRAYSPAHPLPPTPWLTQNIFPSGLALVMAEPPSPTGETSVDYQMIAANDPVGRRLIPLTVFARVDGDALNGTAISPGYIDPATGDFARLKPDPKDPARLVTLFLRPPTAGAKTFNLRMERMEKTDLHKSETLTFPDIPAPPKPPAPQ